MEIPFYQVDVFTDHIFGGNPLAVFPQSQCLQEEYLQKIAREMNLSETTFVYPSSMEEADFDVRIFTPTQELPFAGHPTLGTAYILREKGYITPNHRPIRLNFKVGVITVWQENGKNFMLHPPAKTLHTLDRSEKIAQSLGLNVSLLDEMAPIQVVSTGLPALIVPVKTLQAMQDIVVNPSILQEVLQPLGVDMIYPFCRETLNDKNTVHARAFAPMLGITEDPATGSVAGAMGAYWSNLNDERVINMLIEQGFEMGRPSLISVEINKEVGETTKIRVGGETQPVFTGSLQL
jgi:trans-2,3-dihydro-3-hydroxyanthranilate isomerase